MKAESKKTYWNILPNNKLIADTITEKYHIHPAVATVLASRGWQSEGPDLEEFLSPRLQNLRDPFLLHDMGRGVDRVAQALKNKERICIYGDYDVDGVSSTALLVCTLRFLGCDPYVVIPHRINDGYGMNNARIEEIHQAKCSLIITVDTGITAVEQTELAKSLGIDVVVTDHHLASDELPAAIALINPNLKDSFYEGGRLCGVGVAFKFAHALLKQVASSESEAKAFLMNQLDLVALGTIADVVPLKGENRVFALKGMEALLKTQRPGLKALLKKANYRNGSNPELIGFGLGPRLNAAGRTSDPMIALELLLTDSESEAEKIANDLEALNRDRRAIEQNILDGSLMMAEDLMSSERQHIMVVGNDGWHIGVVGIVASRLTEQYDIPSIVLGIDEGIAKGSARSVPGFDIREALAACAQHLLAYGGHAAAAGLKLESQHMDSFRSDLNAYAEGIFKELDRTIKIDVDAELDASHIDWKLFDDLQKLQPFGEGNPAPVYCVRGLDVLWEPKIVGRGHLRCKVGSGSQQFGVIGFNQEHLKPHFQNGKVDLLCRPKENVYNGYRNLELELIDARLSVED